MNWGTNNGQVYVTYRDASKELNLLENYANWDTALTIISNTAIPERIRTLFVIKLIIYFPSNSKDIWEKRKAIHECK